MATSKPRLSDLTAQTGRLADLHRRLDELLQEMEEVKQAEKQDAVASIREQIELYEITSEDLFGKPLKRDYARTVPPQPKRRKARIRRSFTLEGKQSLVKDHRALVAGGMTYGAACKKLDVGEGQMRDWYRLSPPAPDTERKQA